MGVSILSDEYLIKKMRKIVNLLLVLSLISGCSPSSSNENDLNKYETVKNYDYIEEVDGFKTNKIDINNTSDLEFDKEYTYGFYKDQKEIFYQEFTNYINLFQNMFDEKVEFYHYKEKEQWKVEITYDKQNSSNVIFDFKNNYVTLSTFDALESMFKNDTEDSELDEISKKLYKSEDSYKTNVQPKEIVLDLNFYGLELLKIDDSYLVPTYLLQFILSAYDNKLFYNGTSFDYFNLMDYDGESEINDTIVYTPELIDYATKFNSMIFDNFYGLKDYKGDYQERLKNTNDINDYSTNFSNFILSLNDRHTTVLNYAFGDYDGYATEEEYTSYIKEDEYAKRIGCSGSEKDIEQEIISDDTLYVAVNSLNEASFANDYLDTINTKTTKDYKNIVLDLRCNGGGYVFNASVLLYPFTNEDIIVNYTDITGGKTEAIYAKNNKKEKLVKSNVYVLTSDLTFSAANEATMLFKDYEIGTIIGEKSGGGAATISSYNSPSGAYIIMSSGGMLCVNKNGEVVENGIDVDYSFEIQKDTFKQDVLKVIEEDSR